MSKNRTLANLADYLDSAAAGGGITKRDNDFFIQSLTDSDLGGSPVTGLTDSSTIKGLITTSDIVQKGKKVTTAAGLKTILQGSINNFNPSVSATYDLGDSSNPLDEIILDSASSLFFGALSMTSILTSGTSAIAAAAAAATWYGDRAIIGTSSLANVQYYDITTTGNSSAFGTLVNNRTSQTGVLSDTTYALFGGGYNNDIDYVTISTTGNGSDFGDLTVSRGLLDGSCDGTYGIWGGGYSASTFNQNTIDYVTTATPGNASDFGDLSTAIRFAGAFNNGTYGLFAGGFNSNDTNVIEYVTMTSPGNASDFGDLTAAATTSSCSNSTYGLIHLNYQTGSIDYITMATPGNASDFGNLATTGREVLAACANETRATFNGGDGGETVIDYVTIASPGNATDFGDLAYDAEYVSGASGSPS